MTSEMILKQKYARDPLTRLARQYQTKIKAAHREIDEHVRSGCSGKVTTPNYTKEVILPLAKLLSDALPTYDVLISDQVEVIGQQAYFMVSLGGKPVGGLSYPGPYAAQVDFTIFAHEKPWGNRIGITKSSQLTKLLRDLAAFLGYDNKEEQHGVDER